jgi:RNA polymerase sigma-70 factor (ECF subfamily)
MNPPITETNQITEGVMSSAPPSPYAAAEHALSRGNMKEGRRLITVALAQSPLPAGDWTRLQDIRTWPDAWLVAAIRNDPPDEEALDELAARHWKSLFGRCRLVALNRDDACDLAQEAWVRVLKSRHRLNPEKNFPAYLATIAMNLWRDRYRSERRAGALSEHRRASLDLELTDSEGESVVLGDSLPDLNVLEAEKQSRLMLDIDEALGRLSPLLREVIVARFLGGESAAEIGRRHVRTEQTITGWLRQGIEELKSHLLERRETVGRKPNHE